ncbi:MAG: glutathione S-transferase N-terminal domain-containing protein [Alphaproteobacteria bacterium]|jgi:glutathione S-transferase|nr:glutathione S-transferase N-terminal domain-containing protein [Alphaproteobacteria bacterium]
MKLFWTPASPFTRKVSVVARELGLWDNIEILPTTWSLEWGYRTVPFTPGLMEVNPVARIPTLITDGGDALGDSTMACLYLNDVSNSTKLIPDSEEKWQMWSLYGIADGMLEAQILMRAEHLRPRDIRSDSFLDKQRDRIARCLDAMEARAGELDGPLDLAQITVGVTCSYQDWRDWLDDFRLGRPRLAEWYAQFSERNAMKITEPQETPEQ